MKRIVYNLIICCAAILSLAACIKEGDTLNEYPSATDGNNIILDLSSGTLPLTRATAEGAEVAVSHLDVIIFNEDETFVWHERRTVDGTDKTGKVILAAKRNKFSKDAEYWVYLIANSTLPEADFAKLTKLDDLKAMTQKSENIHMTGLANLPDMPQTFLMDGVAYAGDTEPTNAAAVKLTDGIQSNNTELKVTLRRAAAKIVVKIKKGGDVTFDNSPASHNAGYYLRNMPYTTSVVPVTNFHAELMTPNQNSGSYFNWTENLVTVTAYAYAHDWEHESLLEEVRLVVNIPLTYLKDTDPQLRPSNYYQIPVSEQKVLNRNGYYEVTVTVNAPGAEDPSEPVTLTDVNYSVKQWDETTINVGGESDRPKYLTVNKEEMEMYNIEDDNTTLSFASSSTVTAEITRVWYVDKFGNDVDLAKIEDTDEWSEQGNTNKNRCTIQITPDPGINGKIGVHSTVPANNTIRYITVKIKNREKIERFVTIAQYPLEYIVNKQSSYSYRDDFKTDDSNPTTYVYRGDRIYGISLATRNISNWDGRYDYEYSYKRDSPFGVSYETNTNSGFFRSKVVTEVINGKSTIKHYYWNSDNELTTSSSGEYNGRLYHVTLTASSDKYTLGNPRLIEDKDNPGLMVTDPGPDNAELVSPTFMIASSLGGFMLGSGNLTLDDSENSLRVAREHCANYVEVIDDGTVYNDWRLPTRAELEIIMDFQGTEYENADAIDYLLNAEYYYCANGRVYNSKENMGGTGVRCIRDAYDTNK